MNMIQHAEKLEADDNPPNTGLNTSDPGSSTNHEEASSSGSEMQYPPDVKIGFDELCPVCGDKVSGYHYGLLTCESCKGFFKRTVQNKKVYSCVDNRSCHIDKSQRKRCPYCRFQKCLSVGMKLEAVRQDRMRGGRNKFGPMYKRDRALKQQALRQQQQLLASCQMRLANGINMMPQNSDQDIKPDPAILQQMTPEVSMSYSMNSSPLSGMPSPAMPDSPPTDLSRISTSQSMPTSANTAQVQYSMPPNYHPSVMMSTQYTTSSHHSHHHHHYNHHQQMSPLSPVAPPVSSVVPQLIMDMKSSMADENEIKQKLVTFLQTEFGHEDIMSNPTRVLHMICKLSDQLLFLMVEWARTSFFFKDLKSIIRTAWETYKKSGKLVVQVEDQMKLLQNCWSEILMLDFVHRMVRETWSGEVVLLNGQTLSLDCLDKLGLGDAKDRIHDIVRKMKEMKIDINEYLCLKFLILLNPDVPGLENRGLVEQSQEQVNTALMEYCVNFYPHLKDKFGQVLLRLPEIKLISIRAEEFLYYKHLNGEVPDQTLLIEMLHSKKK